MTIRISAGPGEGRGEGLGSQDQILGHFFIMPQSAATLWTLCRDMKAPRCFFWCLCGSALSSLMHFPIALGCDSVTVT
jgi:hypothetical protein